MSARPIVVPASQWRHQSWRQLLRISRPTPENWGHHSGSRQSKTFATMLGNERYHVRTLGWRAPAYSFAYTTDRIDNGFARIFVMRDWGNMGGHTKGRNGISHGHLFAGTWDRATPEEIEAVARSVAWNIDDGAKRGFTDRTMTGGHRQAPGAATTCPGDAGMQVVARVQQLLAMDKFPWETEEEDDMTPEQDARLKTIEQAVTQLGGSIGVLSKRVATVEEWNRTGRRLDVDSNRLRMAVRQIAAKIGLDTEHEVPDGPVGA